MPNSIRGHCINLTIELCLLDFTIMPKHIPITLVEIDDHVTADPKLELEEVLLGSSIETLPRPEPIEMVRIVTIAVIAEITFFVPEGIGTSTTFSAINLLVFPTSENGHNACR